MPLNPAKFLKPLTDRYSRSAIPRFFAWWWSELLGVLPSGLRKALNHQPPALVIERSAAGISIYRQNEGRVEKSETLEGELDASAAVTARRLLNWNEEPAQRTIFCLPSKQVLVKRLSFPIAAEENLRQVLNFEMDRQTPFKADQVYFDYRVVKRDENTKQLDVDFGVIPKALLDKELAELEKLKLNIDTVDAARGQSNSGLPQLLGLNLLPQAKRHETASGQRRLNFILAFSAMALLWTALYMSLGARQQALKDLTALAVKEAGDAKAVEKLERDVREAIVAANFLTEKSCMATKTVDMLLELTQRIPEDTWLERLTMLGDKVQLQGQSNRADKLIAALDQAATVKDAQFQGPIQPDPSTKKERFTLQTTMQKAIAPAGSPCAKTLVGVNKPAALGNFAKPAINGAPK
jgi:general secretion pathway protein L